MDSRIQLVIQPIFIDHLLGLDHIYMLRIYHSYKRYCPYSFLIGEWGQGLILAGINRVTTVKVNTEIF